MSVNVYASGPCACSVCVPLGMAPQDVEAEVNRENPTGIASPWKISAEPFKGGEPNPSPCNDVEGRVHYLMTC